MKTGAYIIDRLLPGFIIRAAQARNITCEALSDDWVFRLERNGVIRWVLGYQFDLNKAAASALAQDKVATYLLLQRAGIASIEHILVRSLPHEPLDATLFENAFAGEPFVLKPLDGTGGRGVQKVSTPKDAVDIVLASGEVAWAASPLHDITAEYRVILLRGTALLTYEKTLPTIHHGLLFYNLGLGAQAVDVMDGSQNKQIIDLARNACVAASLQLASVDIVKLTDGSLRVLEINDGIMMENYARQSAEYADRAALVYDAIIDAMFS